MWKGRVRSRHTHAHALQRRGSVCLSRRQDFVGSARRSTDRARTRKPATTAEVDALVQETNRRSCRWLAEVELLPEDFQGGAEERARAAEAPEEGADAAGGLMFEPGTVDVAAAASMPHRAPPPPPPTHAEPDVDVAPPHRQPSPPQAAADRGRGDAEDSGMVGEGALAQAEAARIEHLARRIKSEVAAR